MDRCWLLASQHQQANYTEMNASATSSEKHGTNSQLLKVTKIHIKIIWYCSIQADKMYIYLDYLASIK